MRLDPVLLLLVASALGCQPDIGDPCSTPSDCSFSGDRICLTAPSQPGGYCTIFNCEPNRCPDEAVCVAFRSALSEVDGCQGPGTQRLQRTFCMKRCSSDSDCRSRYACVDIDEDNPFSAKVVDRGESSAKICAVPYSGALIPEDRPADVCSSVEPEGLFGPLDGGESTAPPPDASSVDASTALDATVPLDAAVGRDGALPSDASFEPDGRQPEAGRRSDASVPTDGSPGGGLGDAASSADAADTGPG